MSRSEVLASCEIEIRRKVAEAKQYREDITGTNEKSEVSYRLSEYARYEALGIADGMQLCGIITLEQKFALRDAINYAVYCEE